jgi:hypothetical protein
MTYLSRDDILKPRDLKMEEVDVPEWGGIVRVRELTGEARDDYETSLMRVTAKGAVPEMSNRRAKLVARAVVNEDGSPLFSLADVHALGAESAAALERVATVAERLSGLSDEALEDAEGNSEAAAGGDSISG